MMLDRYSVLRGEPSVSSAKHLQRKHSAIFMLIGSVLLLGACASDPKITPSYSAKYEPAKRELSFDQAMSFERALRAKYVAVPSPPSETLFTQPINKSEPCKLPTSQDQLERKNFRAYWDGDCKNGYAYGLGRDIAISDTHHVEEITIHNGNGDSYGQPSVFVDFENRFAGYRVTQSETSMAGVSETIVSDAGTFNVVYQVGEASPERNAFAMSSRFSPLKLHVLDEHGVRWMAREVAADYLDDPSHLQLGFMLKDPSNDQTVLAVERYANGAVVHGVVNNGVPEVVQLPEEYFNRMGQKFAEINTAVSKGLDAHKRAQRLEREYLQLACSGRRVIKGLDRVTYTRICNWRDTFTEDYEQAQARYDEHLATQRAKKEAQAQREREMEAESARQVEAAIRALAAQQAQQQLEYQQTMRNLEESNRQLRRTTEQIIESNSRRGMIQQPSTYDWAQPKRQYQAPQPDWTERTYVPTYGPATLTDKRWENGVLWCIYSNGRVRQAGGTLCPYQF